MSILALTLLGAAITVVPAGSYDVRQAVVKYNDLDLSTVDGRDVLDHRLDRAVKLVCGNARNETLSMKMVVRRCVVKTTNEIAPQRQLALATSGVRVAVKK
jgi:UrcA family protein